ncbi:hypothetical protein NMG60_11019142 [Bertholletia excelsa]
MEVDGIQTQGCKFPRIGNGRGDCNKISQKGGVQYPDDSEDRVGVKRSGGSGNDIGTLAGIGRLCGWPSSRIVRVSRASGGKDRHSKVLTSKGLRDRRVRLSVNTAIQFYDLQDRLGYDQPSKAVEWLLKAAARSIEELPSINTFPETPKQLSDEKRSTTGTEQGLDSAEVDLDVDPSYRQQQQQFSLSKSACSSTSETSKGSGLSLSRSESRMKARERAKERRAEREKEKESESCAANNHPNVSPISQSSFTDLLNNGINNVNNESSSPNASAQPNPGGGESNLFQKSRHWSSAPMDYFVSGLAAPPSTRTHHPPGFSGQIHLGNSLQQTMTTSPFNVAGDHHSELQQFSFIPDHLIPVASAGGGGGSDYNLNFTISSSGLAGLNRGTLQSNSPSLLPHLQRLSPIDGSNVPFIIGTATTNAGASMENHHQFPAGLDGRLQLYYGDGGGRQSDQKGKGTN